MTDLDTLAAEVARISWRLHQLEQRVGRMARNRPAVDHRLGAILHAIHVFAHETAWTCSELTQDSRRHAPALWTMLDDVCGSRGDVAVRLGVWLGRHVGVDADGLRLERVRQEMGTWTYRVTVGEASQPPLSIGAKTAILR